MGGSARTPASTEQLNTPWYLETQVRVPARVATVGLIFAGGLLFDFMARAGLPGLAGASFLFLLPLIVFVGAGRKISRAAGVGFVAAAVFGACLAWRSSPWLLPFDVLASVLLLWVGASFARGGSPFDLTIPRVLMRVWMTIVHGFLAVPFAWKPIGGLITDRANKNTIAIVRGIALIAPVLLVLVLLLASADAVFASFFDFDLNLDEAFSHLVVVSIGALLVATLIRNASADPPPEPHASSISLGATEGLIALGSLIVLFSVFVATQLVVWAGGAEHVLETAGLTYAEHAREGFFQLLAVAAITLGVLMAVRSLVAQESARHERYLKTLTLITVGLTLVIVAVALRRLNLYEDAFGLTMLRLYSTVFASWIGIVFLLFALSATGFREGRWFLGASMSCGLLILFGLNIVNPEALVVERNVARNAIQPFDTSYALGLSPDAYPSILDIRNVPPADVDRIKRELCADADAREKSHWTKWNWSKERAATELRERCEGVPLSST